MEDKKTQLDLSAPMRNENGDMMYLPLDMSKDKRYENLTSTELQQEFAKLSSKQIRSMQQVFTLGMGIKQILSQNITIENDNELAMKVFKFIDRINNLLEHNKGKWNVDQDEIKKLQEILSYVKGKVNAIVLGQILTILEEFSAELIIKNKKE